MAVPRIKFSAPLTLSMRIKLPPALSFLPKGAIATECYKAYVPQDLRRLVGFYLPKRGIYDLAGKRIAKVTTARRSCCFVPGKTQVFLNDENGRRVLSVAVQKMRVAFDVSADRIVGVLQPVEFHARSYGDSTTIKLKGKIRALLKSEE